MAGLAERQRDDPNVSAMPLEEALVVRVPADEGVAALVQV
eukprot:CAMPEP_0170339220 /NCGR_PEP_ID=MMETSP0116_2-20130129/70666_1 /TAXON_ID=400756 /ORGANISM="Durinskia baltica, Strain CSIRO CS-38" /LENGTH=39 /DNA_ID= /DNA_START= /DNA_END= /DNA_ORIENTATION=